MALKKQNELNSKLSSLGVLHDEASPDKEMLWEKMEERLHPAQHRTKAGWYWVAACGALLLSAAVFVGTNVFKHDILLPVPAAKKATVAPEPLMIPDKKESFVIVTPESEKVPGRSRGRVPRPVRASATTHEPTSESSDLPQLQDEPIVLSNVPDTAAKETFALVKTNMKVVHINELEAEDQLTSDAIAKIKAAKNNTKKGPNATYAGVLQFRIYLKN